MTALLRPLEKVEDLSVSWGNVEGKQIPWCVSFEFSCSMSKLEPLFANYTWGMVLTEPGKALWSWQPPTCELRSMMKEDPSLMLLVGVRLG